MSKCPACRMGIPAGRRSCPSCGTTLGYRYGLLAMILTMFFFHAWVFLPITTDLSAWYAGDFALALVIYVALAFYSFYISLAGQPLFRGKLLED